LFSNALRFHASGATDEAIRAYRVLVKAHPLHYGAWLNLGLLHLGLRHFDKAIKAISRAAKLRPKDADVRRTLARAYAESGDLGVAVRTYGRAHKLAPRDANIVYDLAAALHSSGRNAEAEQRYRQAIALNPAFAAAYNDLGILYREVGRYEDALAMFEGAVKADPSIAAAKFNLGGALTECGRLDEARAAYEGAVDLAPRNGQFLYHLAESRTFRTGDRYRQLMIELAQAGSTIDPADRIGLAFALGKAEADLGDSAAAFGHYARGNAMKRERQPYDEAAALAELRAVAQGFTPEVFDRLRQFADPSRLPIFVVGMPRCGSTLVAQILCSHPEVTAIGEVPYFGDELTAMRQRLGAGGDTAALLAQMDAADAALMTRGYLVRLSQRAPFANRVNDKALINFRLVGLIKALLPNATIVHVKRDPIDTCWSCYTKLFADYQPFAYDLGELGRYYATYTGVMAHWQQVLPQGAIVEVQYEDLVSDFENQCRRLLEACELSWNDRCLEFHRTQRWVRTSSAMQVRTPLFHSGVGRSHPYAPFLGPLIREVAHLG